MNNINKINIAKKIKLTFLSVLLILTIVTFVFPKETFGQIEPPSFLPIPQVCNHVKGVEWSGICSNGIETGRLLYSVGTPCAGVDDGASNFPTTRTCDGTYLPVPIPSEEIAEREIIGKKLVRSKDTSPSTSENLVNQNSNDTLPYKSQRETDGLHTDENDNGKYLDAEPLSEHTSFFEKLRQIVVGFFIRF